MPYIIQRANRLKEDFKHLSLNGRLAHTCNNALHVLEASVFMWTQGMLTYTELEWVLDDHQRQLLSIYKERYV